MDTKATGQVPTPTEQLLTAVLAIVEEREKARSDKAHKKHGESIWRSKEGASYTRYAPLGQVHVIRDNVDYGIAIQVFDYGEKASRSSLRDENEALKARIAELEKATA